MGAGAGALNGNSSSLRKLLKLPQVLAGVLRDCNSSDTEDAAASSRGAVGHVSLKTVKRACSQPAAQGDGRAVGFTGSTIAAGKAYSDSVKTAGGIDLPSGRRLGLLFLGDSIDRETLVNVRPFVCPFRSYMVDSLTSSKAVTAREIFNSRSFCKIV